MHIREPAMIPRFRHVLVPLDFTPKNAAALDVAFEICAQNKARATLFHAIETIEHAEDDEIRDFYSRLESRAQSELASAAQRFLDAGYEVETKVHFGRRGASIVEFAAGHSVDLIVMSSHPVDRARPLESFATLSYQVAALCACAILLVK
jgi:nucleotide-binding universal stress UspA family protein